MSVNDMLNAVVNKDSSARELFLSVIRSKVAETLNNMQMQEQSLYAQSKQEFADEKAQADADADEESEEDTEKNAKDSDEGDDQDTDQDTDQDDYDPKKKQVTERVVTGKSYGNQVEIDGKPVQAKPEKEDAEKFNANPDIYPDWMGQKNKDPSKETLRKLPYATLKKAIKVHVAEDVKEDDLDEARITTFAKGKQLGGFAGARRGVTGDNGKNTDEYYGEPDPSEAPGAPKMLSASYLEGMKAHYKKIKSMDAKGQDYMVVSSILDKMPQHHLKQVAEYGIPFMSPFAKHRIK